MLPLSGVAQRGLHVRADAERHGLGLDGSGHAQLTFWLYSDRTVTIPHRSADGTTEAREIGNRGETYRLEVFTDTTWP